MWGSKQTNLISGPYLSYSLAVVLNRAHISCCQIVASSQNGRSHPQVHQNWRIWRLPADVGFRWETVKPSDCGSDEKQPSELILTEKLALL